MTRQGAHDAVWTTALTATPETIAAADCVVILTNHSSFDYGVIAERAALVVDTRNALKAHRRAGSASIVTL